ncbi:MAG: pyridoxal-phosphate dependent enzyme [Acidimicrobiia bacterium]|nr:pyridoxal-phosphate dependent enzyme [Acidimicrobiia bacterium]
MRCVLCATEYPPAADRYVCDACGPAGTLDVEYDWDRVLAGWGREALAADPDSTMWRWGPMLPLATDAMRSSLAIGATPVYEAPRLAAAAGVRRVWVKDEGRQPTGSLKDRASAMVAAIGAGFGAEVITTASTGNAASALAGVTASMGLRSVIFVPEAAPPAKVTQLLAYGATVMLVQGGYSAAFELSQQAVARYGWYDRNTGINPYTTEGKKTALLELAEQLGWSMPDAVFVAVGDGSIIGGLHKGLVELHRLGWIDRIPRLFGVQAAGSDYLAQAYESGEEVAAKPAIAAHTVADSISADLPRDRVKAMRAVRHTGGTFVRVPDEAILAAIAVLARGCGVFAEPAAAAAWAGVERAVADGLLDGDATVAVLATGSGLKDVAAAQRAVAAAGSRPMTIEPNLEALEQALEEPG